MEVALAALATFIAGGFLVALSGNRIEHGQDNVVFGVMVPLVGIMLITTPMVGLAIYALSWAFANVC